jgi:hypothetical protein
VDIQFAIPLKVTALFTNLFGGGFQAFHEILETVKSFDFFLNRYVRPQLSINR